MRLIDAEFKLETKPVRVAIARHEEKKERYSFGLGFVFDITFHSQDHSFRECCINLMTI